MSNQISVYDSIRSITYETIQQYIDDFDQQEGLKEEILQDEFANKENCDEKRVLRKVALLNAFYSTQLFNNPGKADGRKKNVDIQTMAKHIVTLSKEKNLDKLIMSSCAKDRAYAIRLIRCIDESLYSDAYSFATKYCSWNNPNAFPIVDRYSKGMLYYLCRTSEHIFGHFHSPITQSKLSEYDSFCGVHQSFREAIFQKTGYNCTCKDIDKFLWLFGVRNNISID